MFAQFFSSRLNLTLRIGVWNEQYLPQSSKCSGHDFDINFITFFVTLEETNSSAYNLDFKNKIIIGMTAEKLIVKTIVEPR